VSEAVVPAATSPGGRWRIPLWLDILVTAAFVLLFARLIYLPQARPLGSDDTVTAPAGQWLVLDGLTAGTVLEVAVDAPGEVGFSAPSASLDDASRTYLQSLGVPTTAGRGPVRWAASAAGGQKATLVADLTVEQPGARLALSAIPGTGLKLRVDRGTLAVSLRLDSDGPARGLLDAPGSGGAQAYGPGRPIAFLLSAGGSSDAALDVAVAKPSSLRLLQDDGSEAPLALTNLEVDADRAVLTRTCGGAEGRIVFWPALLQPRARPIPALSMCEPGRMTVGELVLQPSAVVAKPSGSAYVPGELPVWNTLKDNPAVGALLLAIIGYPAARLLGQLRRLHALFRGGAGPPPDSPDKTKA
jgi:hypothetical protein